VRTARSGAQHPSVPNRCRYRITRQQLRLDADAQDIRDVQVDRVGATQVQCRVPDGVAIVGDREVYLTAGIAVVGDPSIPLKLVARAFEVIGVGVGIATRPIGFNAATVEVAVGTGAPPRDAVWIRSPVDGHRQVANVGAIVKEAVHLR